MEGLSFHIPRKADYSHGSEGNDRIKQAVPSIERFSALVVTTGRQIHENEIAHAFVEDV
jgi:hypothetical protein